MSNDFRKPAGCLGCEGTDVRFIIRGLPTDDAMREVDENRAVLAGCMVGEGMPMWRCMECGDEFSDEDDPAVIELRKIERRLFGPGS